MALLVRARLLIAVLVILLASSLQAAQTIDRLMAVVGGDPIFLSDVRQAEKLKMVDPEGSLATVTTMAGVTAEQLPLEHLINRRLVLAEVTRYQQPAPSAADIDRALEAWAARFDSDAQRDAAIESAAGGSRAVVRAFLADSLRINRYFEQRFTAAAQPTRAEVRAFYQANLGLFAPAAFEEAEEGARERLADTRRLALVRDWLTALRNRAQVQVVSSQRD